MKRMWLAVVSLVLCAGLVEAQSLVDLAKKEKERRKKNTEQGQEVKKFSGGGESDGSSSEASDESAFAENSPNESRTGKNDDWDWRLRSYQWNYDRKKRTVVRLEREAKDCQKRKRDRRKRVKRYAMESGKSYLTDDGYKEDNACDSYPGRIEDAKRAMQKIEADCANDARKRKILPGRARLRK